MRVVFMGTPDFAVPSLERLAEAHDVRLVLTRPDAVRSRGKSLVPSPVAEAAERLGIPVAKCRRMDGEAIARMREAAPDVACVAAFGCIVPDEALAIPPLGCVNVHASLLPRWRGAAPIQRAMLAGDERVGVSIMRVVHDLDAGAWCRQASLEVGELTCPELTTRLASLGADELLSAHDEMQAGTCAWEEQDPAQVTYAEKVGKAELLLDPELTARECVLRVQDVKKTPKGYYVHTCTLESGIVHVGDHLTARVDKEYRMAIARNHTATHLLQAALREVLGDHVHQAGSYQDAEITHFDFTHFSAVTPEELIRVQKIVNDKIFESMNVTVKEMPIEEAKKLGAMALFGEKYGKVVRVVDIEGWSTEFCGGTHVKNTAQIGGFKIVSESSVAAGIRRIEAVTGRNLLIRANMQEAMLHTVANTLKANNVAALPARAEAVMAENKAMSKELEDIKAKVAASKVTSLFDNAETVGDVKIASAYFTGTSGETLRGMCDTIRDSAKAAAVAVLVGKSDDKITMAVTVTKDAQAKGLKAGNLVKEISAIAGGKGGGKPDFAMAGLKDETKIDEALAAVKGIVEKQLG